ncbi:MAG: penicillin-binding protein [Acidobacteria bacterium]|nr:penicillin-binding protein [Acidobacteriota bacterium]
MKELVGRTLPAIAVLFLCVVIPARGQRKVIARTDALPATKSSTSAAKVPATATPKSKRKVLRKVSAPARLSSSGDPTTGDDPSKDDPVIRAAAVEALGNVMGSVIVVDPNSGRILTVVNQKLAFEDGYQPCSTFKPAVALAALEEGVLEKDRARLLLGKKWYLDLRDALALSNNLYFEKLGKLLGIEKLQQYAALFGFGEPAGWEIAQEPSGLFPLKPPPANRGGVGKIASFGEGISMTLFQYASFIGALANGGTLYYLQYPESLSEPESFEPKVKRDLNITPWLDMIRKGMQEAVLTGTAKRARQPDVSILGKTGTCSQKGAKLGWFGGYSEEGLAVVVLLKTGNPIGGGPRASEVAGQIYRKLADQHYLAKFSPKSDLPTAIPATIQISPNF